MSDPTQPLLDAVGDETAATPADIARLRAALPADLSSVRRAPVAPPRIRAWRVPAALALLAAAAGVALALWPAPGPTTAPLSVDLATLGPDGVLDLEGLRLTAQGVGALEGTDVRPRLRWELGTVRLEVDPAAGRTVTVETPDGAVEVLGTILRVARDPLGTEVVVERGRVAFTCAGGDRRELGAGDAGWCLPITAGGLLGRARALEAAQAAPDTVLATLDAGRAVAVPSSAIAAELAYRRLPLLVALDRPSEAVSSGMAYLEAGHTLHRAAVAAQTGALAVGTGDCEAAGVAAGFAGDAAPPLGPCASPAP
jgi:hypothetical protein